MNIHAFYSLILTSSAHLFCKGLPNTMPTTFVLLIGLSKASYISSRDVSIIENVREMCSFSKRQPHWALAHEHSQVKQFP